jgi:membrane associated rhomboid family serine protease
MFFPFADDNPTVRPPAVTVALIAVNVVVFLYQLSLPEPQSTHFVFGYGMIPAVVFGAAHLPATIPTLDPWLTVVSSMFLHGSIMHIFGNMLFLWVFGNNIEDSLGHARYLLFYLLSGIAAALTQGLIDPSSEIPMIGASGAISGVLGAYLVLHPHAHVRVLIFILIFIRILVLPAMIVLGIWFLFQVVSALAAAPDEGGVAWFAHIGGFVAGAALIFVMRPAGQSLFGGGRRRGPWG